MANLAPKIGDLVHYVLQPSTHLPAFVLEDVRHQADPIPLFVVCTSTTAVRWTKTLGLDSFPSSMKLFESVRHAPAAQDKMDTWHWPEHRAQPRVPVGEAAEEPI